MSDKLPSPRDFVCPTCNAQIGDHCKWDHGGKHATWHKARYTLYLGLKPEAE